MDTEKQEEEKIPDFVNAWIEETRKNSESLDQFRLKMNKSGSGRFLHFQIEQKVLNPIFFMRKFKENDNLVTECLAVVKVADLGQGYDALL